MTVRNLRRIGGAILIASVGPVAAEISLFEDDNFRGNSMRITSEVVSLDGTGMNDRTQSAIVRDGVWEVCRDAYFNGGCIQLPPGRYPHMERR